MSAALGNSRGTAGEDNISEAINISSDSVLLMDTDTTVIAANPAAALRLKRTEEQLVGMDASQFLSAKIYKKRMKKFDEVLTTKDQVCFEDKREVG